MFRTGHRTDPRESEAATEVPAPIEKVEPKAVESKAVEPVAAAPLVERSAARPAERSEAVLGRGVTFDGTLRFEGALRIEGSFKGHILAGGALDIAESADVSADVICETITVTGEARGSLTATRSLQLRSPARVSADLTTPSLLVDEGVLLEGAVRMRGAPARVRRERPKGPTEITQRSAEDS
jgi:cytoskeletal protein CcmA (bactofilin family)